MTDKSKNQLKEVTIYSRPNGMFIPTYNPIRTQVMTGTELLKALSSTDTASTGITLATASDDFYLVAYQNGNAYLYMVTDTGDTNATASEIALVSVFQGVAAGAFASGDFIA